MAGFEGPQDAGAGGQGPPKLPSWAVTRSSGEPASAPDPGPAARDTFAGLPAADPARSAPRADPPVSRVPEHPFDIDDPFGDKQLGGTSSPWIRPPADDTEVQVVDLADEFNLTTVQALEVCSLAGTPAASGAAWLTLDQAAAFRSAVATYDRSGPSVEEFPDWAVPPGGPRPRTSGPVGDAVVPGAMLLTSSGPVEEDDAAPSAGRLRIILLLLLVLAIAGLVALVVLG